MGSLVCQDCGATAPLNASIWRCECGGLLNTDFAPHFDLERIASRPPNLWRYREALPIGSEESVVSFGEGFTPLVEIDVGGRSVLAKQDYLFPTGSYKDRGAAVLVSKAVELGVRHVVEDSSGNAGCAIAAYCARAEIACDIYVPEATSEAKLAQIRAYGARLHRVPGSREQTARAALEAAANTYYASHSWNPFFFQGTKTFAFEVCEQLGWRAPDTVILPVGNGTLLLGCDAGFRELRDAGVIDGRPKIVAVQAAGCAPLADAFDVGQNEPVPVSPGATLAEGIAIAEPVRGAECVAAVRGTRGCFVRVGDSDIADALRDAGRMGLYIEPTAAATLAGAQAYCATAAQDESIVVALTGSGLKSTGGLYHE